MADLVTQHGGDLLAIHLLQQTGAHRHQRAVFRHASGKRIHFRGVVDGHLGHPDAGVLRVAANRVEQPALDIILRLRDHSRARRHLGHPFGYGQRNERAAHTEHGGEGEQTAHAAVTTAGRHLVDTEQMAHDAQQQQDREIGSDE